MQHELKAASHIQNQEPREKGCMDIRFQLYAICLPCPGTGNGLTHWRELDRNGYE